MERNGEEWMEARKNIGSKRDGGSPKEKGRERDGG